MFQRMIAASLLVLAASTTWSLADDDNKADAKKHLKPASVAHIHLAGNLDETPVAADPLFGTSAENFKTKMDRIHKATDDKEVAALYIHIDGAEVGWAKIQELRQAIAKFRKSGRKAYAYFDSGTAKDYLVASECDVICMPESGWLVLVGLQAEITFYKELLEMLGIHADFLQMGVYKFAAEPYTRSTMSKEARAQMTLVLDDFYKHCLVETIAKSRLKKDMPASKIEKIIDSGPFTAKNALKQGLVDRVLYQEEVEALIKKDLKDRDVKIVRDYGMKKKSDIDFSNPFAVLKLFMPTKATYRFGKDRIALIYATGPIVTGKGGASLLGGNSVGSTTLVKAIRKAEQDPKVKAIVLRVDSPGGSALASDLIWRELRNCKKPVVASMSDVAASGGYYISAGAQKIFAQPGTLTGSIGVVGGKFALAGLYKKVGITTETIRRGKNAGIFSSTEPFTKSERKAMEKLMEEIYDQFLTKVIEGRALAGQKFTRKKLITLAEGRVWTGRQAHELGLVDELGGLDDAIAEAKRLAGLAADEDVDYMILPKARSFLDSLVEGSGDASMGDAGMFSGMATRLPLGGLAKGLVNNPDVRRHLNVLEGMSQLRSEPVWLMMPHGLYIR